MSDPVESIDGEAVEKDVALAYKVLYKMGKVRSKGSCRLACRKSAALPTGTAQVAGARGWLPLSSTVMDSRSVLGDGK